jgi:hypothetical protein
MPAGNPGAYSRLAGLAAASVGGTPEPAADPSASSGVSFDSLLAALGKANIPPALLLQLLALLSGAGTPGVGPAAGGAGAANPILAALMSQGGGGEPSAPAGF